MTIRVLVADDQELIRTGLRMILDAQPDIEVVGEAANGREAVTLARRLRPDVCLFDIRMPELDGIEATRRLAGPEIADPMAIVIITTFDLDEYVHGALKAGARGFLLKDAGPDLMVQAIHAAADGEALIAPSITVRLLGAFAKTANAQPVPAEPFEPLTEREEQVLVTVALGHTNAEIAEQLHISLSTVKTHPRQPHGQAEWEKPRRDRHVGIRIRARLAVTGRDAVDRDHWLECSRRLRFTHGAASFGGRVRTFGRSAGSARSSTRNNLRGRSCRRSWRALADRLSHSTRHLRLTDLARLRVAPLSTGSTCGSSGGASSDL